MSIKQMTWSVVQLYCKFKGNDLSLFFQQLTLLHWAADRGHEGMIRLLAKHGANLNAQDEDGQTPLFYGKSSSIFSVHRTCPSLVV